MADPKANVQAPATDGSDTVTRTPEEDLAAIEAKAGAEGELDEGGKTVVEVDPAAADAAAEEKVRQYMKKKGINDFGKIVDLASDYESKNTKLDQEVRRLSAVSRFPAGGEGAIQTAGPDGRPLVADGDLDIEIPENPIDLVMDKTKLKKFALDLVKVGENRATRRDQERDFESIKARVQAKMEANPEEFDRLRRSMFELSQLDKSADIDTLYERAKAREASDRKALVADLKKDLGLNEDQTERLKGLSARLRTTPITSGTGIQVTTAQSAGEKENQDLLKAIATADKY